MRYAVRCKRSGKARGVLILLLALLIASFAIAWIVVAGRGRVTAYVKAPRNQGSILDDSGPESWEDYRRRRDDIKTLLTSPLVIDAALQNQNLADTYVVRDRNSPLQLLTESISVEFPNDGEIMQISLSCKRDDAEQAVKVLDAVIRAFQDKVLLTQRLKTVALRADLQALVQEMKPRLETQLRQLHDLKNATPPANAAEIYLLEESCELESQLYKKLRLHVLKQELLNSLHARAEAAGGSASDEIEVIQTAVVDNR